MNDQNKRTIRALILCVAFAMIYTRVFLSPPKKPVQPGVPAAVTAASGTSAPIAAVPTAAGNTQIVNNGPQGPVKHPSKAELTASPITTIETGKVRASLSHLGGRITSYALKDYKVHLNEDRPLDMIDNLDGTPFPLALHLGKENDDYILYTLDSVNGAPPQNGATEFKTSAGSGIVLSFSGTMKSGRKVSKKFSFQDDSYLVYVDVTTDPPLDPKTAGSESESVAWLEWSHYYPKSADNPRLKITHLTYLDGYGKIKHVTPDELPNGLRDFGTSQWVSLADTYFMATLIPSVSGRNTQLGKEEEVYYERVAGTAQGGKFTLYIGPKDYKTLQYVGYNLERSIDLGWFSFLAYPLLWGIHYLQLILGNYGLAIIALTLIIKGLLLPLTKASLRSMKAMQEVQPEIKALRERVKDPTQLNQEIFALYKRRGVNPMGGCFPMLIQIPVFLGLYQALLNSIELRHSPFALWVTDLSSPEYLNVLGIHVPVMVLLMAASMFAQMKTSPPPPDPAQRKAMMIMPFVFTIMFIIFPMPAGLTLYWLVNNLISVTQQVYLRRENGAPYKATLLASIVIFSVGYVLTLL